jgi:hypothetical protein
MVQDARERVRHELTQLAALEAKLRRAELHHEAQLAVVDPVDDRNGDGAGRYHQEQLPLDTAAPAARPQLTLGSVSFEDLRDLGLSVTEATRVLMVRHRGELVRTADLAGVGGLSPAALQTLKRNLVD